MALYGANPYMPAYQVNIPQAPQQDGITWVQGEPGAKSFLVGAGRSVILMDSENPIFYIKSADQSGMPTLRKFRFEEITNQTIPQEQSKNYVTWDELNKKLEEYTKKRIKKEEANG